MTHLSLFSGIGGLDLAAEWAGFTTVGQCEWADFPRAVLEKHWPDVYRWRDIRDLTADDFDRRIGGGVTVLSGGFPCQPHSVAGQRKASADERDLWPEFRRIVSEIKPRWVVAENVPGLLTSDNGRFFGSILRDLAEMGFDAGWATFSAAAVGAVHRRERVAIVAHANGIGHSRTERHGENADEDFERRAGIPRAATQFHDGIDWEKRARESFFLRENDGVPRRMDRLKAIGNAVVPQQFYPIFKVIAEIEEATA